MLMGQSPRLGPAGRRSFRRDRTRSDGRNAADAGGDRCGAHLRPERSRRGRGGSTLDLAKGVAILTRNPGRGIDYRGMNTVASPGIPVVLIPTTAGTGSEVTETASFIDSATGVKFGINGRHVGCLFAVLDPTFVATCPPSATVSAGLDALVHAVEAATCLSAHPC